MLRLYAVVGCLFGDVDVVGVRFAQTCGTDLGKLAVFFQSFNGRRTAVAHTGTKTAHELIYSVGQGAFERNTTLNAFGNKLLGTGLEVSVLGTLFHSSK